MIDGLATCFSMPSLAASTTFAIGTVVPVYLHTPVLVACHGSWGFDLSLRKAMIRVADNSLPSGSSFGGQSNALVQPMTLPGLVESASHAKSCLYSYGSLALAEAITEPYPKVREAGS
jgi:hypothetical protein